MVREVWEETVNVPSLCFNDSFSPIHFRTDIYSVCKLKVLLYDNIDEGEIADGKWGL